MLHEHPAVAEAARDRPAGPGAGRGGRSRGGAHTAAAATPDELRDYVKARVAAYKYVWITDALPKGPTGKILKQEITPPPNLTAR